MIAPAGDVTRKFLSIFYFFIIILVLNEIYKLVVKLGLKLYGPV